MGAVSEGRDEEGGLKGAPCLELVLQEPSLVGLGTVEGEEPLVFGGGVL